MNSNPQTTQNTLPEPWFAQLQAAIGQARSEILIAVTEPASVPMLDAPDLVQTVRAMLKQHPSAAALILAQSVETTRHAWPRWTEAARWYGHQMHVKVTDPSFERRFDVCVVDRRWVAYSPHADLARSSDSWRCSAIAANPVATRIMEEALEALRRSSPSTWAPAGLSG